MASERLVNPLDALVGYNLRRASAALMAELTRGLEDVALKPSEASVLVLIAANPGITQSMLGRMLGIKRANMAPIAGVLLGRGLIEREPADGRAQRLQVSPSGATRAGDARRIMDAHEEAIVRGLPEPSRTILLAFLAAMRERPRAPG